MLAGSPNEQEASAQSAANEPARSEAWEHSTAAGTARQAQTGSGRNSRQGWRRLLPRFLGQMMPGGQPAREGPSSAGVEVPAVQTTGMQTDVSGQHDQAAPPSSRPGFASQAADTGADAGWFVWSGQPAAMCLLCNAQPAAAHAVHCSCVPLSFIPLQSYCSKGLFRCITTCCVLATSDLCWKIFRQMGTPFVVPSAAGRRVGLLNLHGDYSKRYSSKTTLCYAGQPRQSQALILPDVPNVWDDMNPAAEEMLPSPADSVEYINGTDDNNMANDAMLLIMHAVQARSEGRSLRDDRRSSAEQYWRQMEEDEEAGFFRLSTDGDEAGRQ